MPIQLKQNGEHFASHLKALFICFVAIVNFETNFFGQDSSASMKSQTFLEVKAEKKPTTPCDRDGMKNGK